MVSNKNNVNKGKIQLNLNTNELYIMTRAVAFYKESLKAFNLELWEDAFDAAILNAEKLYIRLVNKKSEYNSKRNKEVGNE